MAAIYAADKYCDDCADDIRGCLLAGGNAPADTEDETSYDSDEYPKRADDDEASDTPQHCGSGETCLKAEILPDGRKVGKLMGDSLTEDGVIYVREAIEAGGLVADLWEQRFKDSL